MARGVESPATQTPLPKVSFVVVQNDGSTQPAGIHDLQARSYGYNDFSEFQKPEHYIRYIEPLESELAIQVEYDMDEQDQEWLDALNVERKKDQLNTVSYETLEIVMDRLEKEWFDLTKNIPKPDLALPSEDSTCAICDDSEGENSNAIVFCDGCNLAVHQDCYGVPYIPEGQWLCRKCTVSPEIPVSCILCPNEGGAFKQTVFGDWAHLLCAIWIPETRVANEVFMEPITGVDKISKQRWKLKCSICGIREGACIQCSKTSCFLAFHATCARKEKLLMPMKSNQGTEPGMLTCYCEKHLPKEQQETRFTALAADGMDGDSNDPKTSKSARAYAKTYKTGPPLVPNIIVERILHYIAKVNIRKKTDFITLVCKYWSLKREARRGAPLLKRLHLEPWTASNANKQQTEVEKAAKLDLLRRFRKDLEAIRDLALLTRKRESRKLVQAESMQKVIGLALLPHEPPLRLAFERILALDRQGLFKNPVSKAEVPDYYDVIQNPMCWNIIDNKLDRHEYWDLQSFKGDIDLVLTNAMIYNKPGTLFYKTAQRVQSTSQTILSELDRLSILHLPLNALENGISTPEFPPVEHTTIGDLEPPLPLLELVSSMDAIQDDINLILDHDPLTSLFDYELGRFKPPPPPPPKLPPPRKGIKRKAVSSARGRALDSSPGFRAPRTRRALAAAAAFEAEAHGGVNPDTDDRQMDGTKQKGLKSRRVPFILPGQSDVPPMVDNVDNQRSFKMFDAGWILPPDQKRGGRVPVDRSTLPPPKKRIRTGQCGETSRLSNFSTPMSEKQMLQASSSLPESLPDTSNQPVPHVEEGEVEVDIIADKLEDSMQVTDPAPVVGPTLPPGAIIAPDGTIIIEELDSPATRRQKNMRRKAEKSRQVASALTPSRSTKSRKLLPSSDRDVIENESDLSSLSDLDSDEENPISRKRRRRKEEEEETRQENGAEEVIHHAGNQPSQPESTPAAINLKEGNMLEDTYPWWPAVIFEPDDIHIPRNVLKERKSARKADDSSLHLVRFFDRTSSWQWLDVSRLLLLKEDAALDMELLAPSSRKQRWKNSSIRQECREAYRRALKEMETDVDAELEGPGPMDVM
ncbi:hypothetical protein SERLA73DRAFT_58213 [Serpula lacrymans var. lacrymans S7.3]|uniref:Uncharacterized protein n=1 Tax=Serpula lacrymans var. lacrymans (strain S7.3) TaxID=936435 RepID=F8Q4I2_SERL3|nr:hypothetical protein SERLA73DRAFT_58213 [Serpula lacrymans var. lacrymans S7.3]